MCFESMGKKKEKKKKTKLLLVDAEIENTETFLSEISILTSTKHLSIFLSLGLDHYYLLPYIWVWTSFLV